MVKRVAFFLYGTFAYLLFLGSFLYAIGFVGNLLAPKSVDLPAQDSSSTAVAIAIDLALIAAFGIQHSVMARAWFKRWWTKVVPVPIERSTYVFIASLLFILIFWQWRPIHGVVWQAPAGAASKALLAVGLAGWGLVVFATFLINHFDLLGLRQVTLFLRGIPYKPVGFRQPWLYRIVRHPVMLGFVVGFWAGPTMSSSRLLFAAGMTVYILIGLWYEERDLVAAFGDSYKAYRAQVSMLIPIPKRKRQAAPAAQPAAQKGPDPQA